MYLSKSRFGMKFTLQLSTRIKENVSNNRILWNTFSLYSTETTFKAVLVDGVGHTENIDNFQKLHQSNYSTKKR